jgi:hypothetical protein
MLTLLTVSDTQLHLEVQSILNPCFLDTDYIMCKEVTAVKRIKCVQFQAEHPTCSFTIMFNKFLQKTLEQWMFYHEVIKIQGNIHLGKYSNFISIKILVKTLTEHCSFRLVYLLQFRLGKLFAISEAPMKLMCVCLCVCVYAPEYGWSGGRARPWHKEVLTSTTCSPFVQDGLCHITVEKAGLHTPPHKRADISTMYFVICIIHTV